MERQEILDLYDWSEGACFRHPTKGAVATTRVKTIRPRAGDLECVRACQECVLEMEHERWVAAAREGVAYEPGRAGEALS